MWRRGSRCASILARMASNSECCTSSAPPLTSTSAARCPDSWSNAQLLHTSSSLHQSTASQPQQRQEQQPAQQSEAGEQLRLSAAAIARLKQLQGQSPGAPLLLRVMVEGGGCSGFQYQFALEEAGPAEGDKVFSRDGVVVVCDDVSLEFLRGATVDYESDLMRSAFVVQENPNAAASCGCGSSFAAK